MYRRQKGKFGFFSYQLQIEILECFVFETIFRFSQKISISFFSLHTVSPLWSVINVMSASCLHLSIEKVTAQDNTDTEEEKKVVE